MIFGNIHRQLFKNLLTGTIIIGILTGISVSLIELKHIDKYVAEIASADSRILSKYYLQYYNNPTDSALTLLRQATQNNIDRNSFIFIELLDKNFQNVTRKSIREFDKISPELLSQFKYFDMSEKDEYETIYFKGRLYIRVMAPIHDNDNKKIIGYFKGIYHLPDDKTIEAKKQSYYSILLSIVVVVTTTFFIYPIIYKLYNKLLNSSFVLLESITNIL